MVRNYRGFTLIELLIVVSIIAILAAMVFVYLDPARRFSATRNAQRWSDVNNILAAIRQHQVDNDGVLAPIISGLTNEVNYVLGTSGSSCSGVCTATSTDATCKDLTGILVNGGYLPEIPKDPKTGSDTVTDYFTKKTATGIIMVGACEPESEAGTVPVIRVSR